MSPFDGVAWTGPVGDGRTRIAPGLPRYGRVIALMSASR
jgi:hypothetical protein